MTDGGRDHGPDHDALYVGLITGTSIDGIDAALLQVAPDAVALLHTHAEPLPETLRDGLRAVAGGRLDAPDTLGALDAELGDRLADAVLALLGGAGMDASRITAIGSHGQSVCHRPDGAWPFTMQIGDPNRIAARTGIATVADFRRRDIAAGGQGAPLAPVFHERLLAGSRGRVGVLNLGGIANLTVLDDGEVRIAFDTGPANTLLDAWCRRHLGRAYDADGAWSRSGHVDAALLSALLADPYFARPPPVSTGPEYFNLAWLAPHLERHPAARPEDIMATLVALTAESIARAAGAHAAGLSQLYLCGGGVHNVALVAALAAALPDVSMADTSALGVGPDWIEACAFAWLAHLRLCARPLVLGHITGSRGPVTLGGVYVP